MLLHAKQHWPEYITTMLWHYALKAAEVYFNRFDVDKDGVSPEEKLSNVCAVRSFEDEHTWRCPVYVLDSRLQDQVGAIPKWNPRSRLGIYLGPSSFHASNHCASPLSRNYATIVGKPSQ
eukprot:1778392-Ditylum_brightwellii.AAC.1